MNKVSVTVFWTIIAVLLTIAAVAPVNSVDQNANDPKKTQNAAMAGGANIGNNKPTATSDGKTGQTTAFNSSSNNNNTHSSQNCTEGRDNVTGECKPKNSGAWYNNIIGKNKGMLERTMYVLIGVTVLVVLYFVIKTIRLRRRKSKTRKYGVLSTSGNDNMEMTPLDQEEDDEDMTVFELNGHARK